MLIFLCLLNKFSMAGKILFPDEFMEWQAENQNFVDKCIELENMPYFDEESQKYSCYPLLERGPCRDDEWFVISESSSDFHAKCEKKLCQQNEFLHEVYYNGRCEVIKTSQKVCANLKMWLLPNLYGKG